MADNGDWFAFFVHSLHEPLRVAVGANGVGVKCATRKEDGVVIVGRDLIECFIDVDCDRWPVVLKSLNWFALLRHDFDAGTGFSQCLGGLGQLGFFEPICY